MAGLSERLGRFFDPALYDYHQRQKRYLAEFKRDLAYAQRLLRILKRKGELEAEFKRVMAEW